MYMNDNSVLQIFGVIALCYCPGLIFFSRICLFFIFTSSSYFGAVLEKAQSTGDLVLDKHLYISKC